MPGWQYDSPPPLVLTARLPPGAMRPPSTKAPPSPLAQKPRSSRDSTTVIVNESYTWSVSTSAGVTLARRNASGPLWAAAVTVTSGICEMPM